MRTHSVCEKGGGEPMCLGYIGTNEVNIRKFCRHRVKTTVLKKNLSKITQSYIGTYCNFEIIFYFDPIQRLNINIETDINSYFSINPPHQEK